MSIYLSECTLYSQKDWPIDFKRYIRLSQAKFEDGSYTYIEQILTVHTYHVYAYMYVCVNTSMFINIILSHTNKHVQNIKTNKEQQKLGDNFFVSSFFSSIHSFFLFEFFGFVIYMVIRCLEASGKNTGRL